MRMLLADFLDASQPGHACDVSHLDSILYNLDKIVEFCALDVESCVPQSDLDDYYSTLSATTAEIGRLNKHSSLFPNSSVRRDFRTELAIIYRNLDRIIDAYEELHLNVEEYLLVEAQEREKDRLPNRDHARTLWQNFLAKDAPGAWHSPRFLTFPSPGTGATQILPIPGCNLITERIGETTAILNKLDDVRPYNGTVFISRQTDKL